MSVERYVRVADSHRFAKVEGDTIVFLSGPPWMAPSETGERAPLRGLRLAAPVVPTKILGVGRNYRAHAKELGNEVPVEPLLFYKPPSSLLEPEGSVVLPPTTVSERVDHEAEIAVVIGTRLRNATLAQAAAAVFALTLSCDVTARDLQKKDGQWWRAKGSDTFCPVGPHLVRGVDVGSIRFRCEVNGEVRQSGSTSDMIFDVPTVLTHVSRSVTLEPGDVILTGTPEGVGPLRPGDEVAISSEALGVLRFRVEGAPPEG